MHQKKYEIQLNTKSKLFFHYTDKYKSYIKLHADRSRGDDGFVCENSLLFSDFALKVNGKTYSRRKADLIQLFSGSFTFTFNQINIKVHCYLPNAKGTVFFNVENPEGFEVIFLLCRKKSLVQKNTFSDKNYYFVFEKKDDEKLSGEQIKNIIDDSEKYYSQVENHLTFDTGLEDVNKALFWAQMSGFRLCTGVNEQKGVWAGLPWFRENWGRDTFIALQGLLLVNGFFEEARQILECFVKHQKIDKNSINYGRIPNRYVDENDVIYNTADGNLWFIKTLWQYFQYTGDVDFLNKIWENIKLAVFSDLDLRTDENGFLINQDSDTWMDARLEGKAPLSPRGNRANDIQALWFETLNIFERLCLFMDYSERIQDVQRTISLLRKNFKTYFWNDDAKILADRIMENNHPDYKIRPNQLFCVGETYNLLDDDIQKQITKDCFEKLSLPYGVTSLSPLDVDFHPYHIGTSKYHKDAAYHNGAIWLWLSGPMISALCKYNWQNKAWLISENHCTQIMEDGCVGTLSENANAALSNGTLKTSGTWSQAWSVAEFTRNFYQDYLGIRPKLIDKKIVFAPKLPEKWKEGEADIFFGNSRMNISWTESIANSRIFVFRLEETDLNEIDIEYDWNKYVLKTGRELSLTVKILSESQNINFASLKDLKSYESLRKKNYMFTKIRKEYKGIKVREVIKND